jgi:hypothetical protein
MPRMVKHKVRVWLTLVFLLPVAAVACRDFEDRAGSSGLAPPPKVNLAGVWQGDWTTVNRTGDSGEITFLLDQDDDDNVFGCSCWTGSACWDDGGFFGIAQRPTLNLAILDILRDPATTSPRLAGIRVNSRLNIVGELLAGTFTVVFDDARRCTDSTARTGDEGTLELRREATGIDVATVCAELALRADCAVP